MQKIAIKVNLIPKPELNFLRPPSFLFFCFLFFFLWSGKYTKNKELRKKVEKKKKKENGGEKKNETVIKSPDKRMTALCRS